MNEINAPQHDVVTDEVWEELTTALARGEAFSNVHVDISDTAETSATWAWIDKNGNTNVEMIFSRPQIDTLPPGEKGRLIRLALHELGHVADYIATGLQAESEQPADQWFYNITDDIAIDTRTANRTSYMRDSVTTDYQVRKTPPEINRATVANKPRHQQLMASIMSLSMLAGGKSDDFTLTEEALEHCGLENIDPEVREALATIFAYTDEEGNKFNLLHQMIQAETAQRLLGSSHEDAFLERRRIASGYIKPFYDRLLKADTEEQAEDNQTNPDQQDGEEDGEAGNTQPEFEYGSSCGHNHVEIETGSPEGEGDDSSDPQHGNTEPGNTDPLSQIMQAIDPESIMEQAEQAQSEHQAKTEAQRQAEKAEQQRQKEEMRQLYELPPDEFDQYLDVIRRFQPTIDDLADIINQLKTERSEEQMSANRRATDQSGTIDPLEAAVFLVTNNPSASANFYTEPKVKEKIAHEFDGLDVIFLVDGSGSMRQGGKAESASITAAIMLETLLLLQSQSSDFDSEINELVRMAVTKFGANDEELCPLTHDPTPRQLGQTFSTIRAAQDRSTFVTGSISSANLLLQKEMQANPDSKRLRLMIILSDGEFDDQNEAKTAAEEMPADRTELIQLMFGSAAPEALTESAIAQSVGDPTKLPEIILPMIQQLTERLGTQNA